MALKSKRSCVCQRKYEKVESKSLRAKNSLNALKDQMRELAFESANFEQNKKPQSAICIMLLNPRDQVGRADPGVPDVRTHHPISLLNELVHETERSHSSFCFCFKEPFPLNQICVQKARTFF